MKYSVVFPRIDAADPEPVRAELEAARALWGAGDQPSALDHVKAASDLARRAGFEARANVLEKAASALARHLAALTERTEPLRSLRLQETPRGLSGLEPVRRRSSANTRAAKPTSARPKPQDSQGAKAREPRLKEAGDTARSRRRKAAQAAGSVDAPPVAAEPSGNAVTVAAPPASEPPRQSYPEVTVTLEVSDDPALSVDFEPTSGWPAEASGAPDPAVLEAASAHSPRPSWEELETSAEQAPSAELGAAELVVTIAREDWRFATCDALVGHRAVRVVVEPTGGSNGALWVRPLSPGEIAPEGTTVALLVGLVPGAVPWPETR